MSKGTLSARNSSSFVKDAYSEDDLIAATVSGLIACFGILCNGGVVVSSVLKLKEMRHHFIKLYVSLAAADVGVLAMFLFWVTPLSALSSLPFASSPSSRKAGAFLLGLFFSSFFAQLAMALNRLIAVFWPRRCNGLYTKKFVVLNVILSYLLGFVYAIPFYVDACDFYYDAKLYIWRYMDTTCGFYIDKVCSAICIAAVSMVFLINLLTYLKIRSYSRIYQKRNNNVEGQVQERRRRKDKEFFVQSCINGSMYIATAILIHLIGRFALPKWAAYFVRTVLWEVAHTTSGVVFIVMNDGFRRRMMWRFNMTKIRPPEISILPSGNNSVVDIKHQLAHMANA